MGNEDKEKCMDFLERLEPMFNKLFWNLNKKFYLDYINTCKERIFRIIITGYIRMKMKDVELIRVSIPRINSYLQKCEESLDDFSTEDKNSSWGKREERQKFSREVTIYGQILSTFYDWTLEDDNQELNEELVKLGHTLKKLMMKYQKILEPFTQQQVLIYLCHMKVMEEMEDLASILKLSIQDLPKFTFSQIFSINRNQFFCYFPSFNTYSSEEQEDSAIEQFIQCRTRLFEIEKKIILQKARNKDLKWLKGYREGCLFHLRTLSMLGYFQSGAPTEQYIDDFIFVLKLAVEVTLLQPEKEVKKDPIRTSLIEILQNLKLFNEKKFNLVLGSIDPALTSEQIYDKIKELELTYQKKVLEEKNQKRIQKRNQEQQQRAPFFNIEELLTAENLTFEKDHFIDINRVDYYISSFKAEEIGIPSGDSLIIEIFGDQNFNSITNTLNLKTESKMATLKKQGYSISWISEEQCKKLNQIEKESYQKVIFWNIVKENLIV